MRPIYVSILLVVIGLVVVLITKMPSPKTECITALVPDGSLTYCGPDVKCTTDSAPNGARLTICRLQPKDD